MQVSMLCLELDKNKKSALAHLYIVLDISYVLFNEF